MHLHQLVVVLVGKGLGNGNALQNVDQANDHSVAHLLAKVRDGEPPASFEDYCISRPMPIVHEYGVFAHGAK